MNSLYQPGDLITPKYKILDILGQGGTAITYEVEDLEKSNKVAIKVLSLQQTKDWKVVELFEREAKALANLKHTNIPKYIDYFDLETEQDKRFFLVQELIPGNSLAILVEKGWHFSEVEVKNIAHKVLNILNYLHSLNPTIIHRDIKPQNIIKTDTEEIYLVDFGAVQDVYRNTITRSGTFVGTIDYMPPEQLRGQVNYSSDLYSLGCTLLYLLTRRSPLELPTKKMKLDFYSAVSISSSFAYWLDILIEPTIEKRFTSTAETLKQLEQLSKPLSDSFLRDRELLKTSDVDLEQIGYKLIIDINRTKKSFYIRSLLLIGCPLVLITKIGALPIIIKLTSGFFTWINNFLPGSLLVLLAILLFFAYILDCIVPNHQHLEIDRDRFYLKFSSWFYRKNITGNVQDIRRIEVTKSKLKHDKSKHYRCVLWEGIRPHSFAHRLKEKQQQILLQEIARFLETLQVNFSK